MTDLTGFPDFAAMITSPDASLIAPFGSGSYSVLPQQLQLAANADGTPKFELDLVQRIGDFSPIGQFAELDFSLAGDFPLDSALGLARIISPAATVKPVTMDGGFGRLYASGNSVPLPADLLGPVPLGWWSTDLARWTLRMTRDAGELIKGALQGQSSLPLGARVEVSVPGVAPRLEAYAQFDPTALLTGLLAGRSDRAIAVTDVLAFFTAPLSKYPVTLTTVPNGNEANLAQIMTDRLVAAYADLAPSPRVGDPPFVRFRPMNEIDTALTRWDLNEPALAMRPWVFMLDPIGSVRALNNPVLLASIVKEVSVPALNLGLHRVDLTTSLPSNRTGIAAVGARVELAADPPVRPFSISKTALFTPPDDTGYVELTLGANEEIQYSVTCFGVIAAGEFVREYDSAARTHTETWVQLTAGDFPLKFANVVASSRLLSLAAIHGLLTYQLGTRHIQQAFTLTAGDGSGVEVTVAAPSVAIGASIALQAVPRDGANPVSLPVTGLGRIELDLHSFPGYGPHTVTMQSRLDSAAAPLFLEFVPELQAANPQTIPAKVALTAEQPSASWGYVATSPFRPGYCFRVAAVTGGSPAPWSAPRLPDGVLMLDANGTVESGPANATPAGDGPPGKATQDQISMLAH